MSNFTLFELNEAKLIEEIFIKCRWNQAKTARELGLSRGCLRIKLKKYFGDKYIGD